MKKIFFWAALILVGCNTSTTTTNETEEPDNTPVDEVAIDASITPATAYNNFFLDSSTVSSYLDKNVSGNESTRIRNFYNTRNFQYAWFTDSGLTEECRNFWNAYTYDDSVAVKDKADKKLFAMMDDLLPAGDSLFISKSDTVYSNAEIAITRKFLKFVNNNRDLVARLLPPKKFDVKEYANIVLKEKRDTGGLTRIERQYDALKRQLAIVIKQDDSKNTDTVSVTGILKKGMRAPAVAVIKRKLSEQGYLNNPDTSSLFNDSLAKAIRAYQLLSGIKPDGLITDSLLQNLSAGSGKLVARILVNMNRLLWLPKKVPDNYIIVNIPEFMLHVYEGENKVFDMKVVVGKEGTSTMMFSGDMNNVVFSPYWNLPASIIKKEVLPGMDRDPNYLASHNMEINGKRGDLPVVRQLPGPDNALGRVKFLFPNSYDIYLHDTNAKGLFDRDKRAYSHGCIRLEDAEKMANYVLRSDDQWTAEKIREAMDSKEEKWVKLKKTEPVLIAYLTTWVDDSGNLQVMEDIYDHDAAAMARLFRSM